jgi:uncharacterized BrkB/YihY/UPF0761 family membrane protein
MDNGSEGLPTMKLWQKKLLQIGSVKLLFGAIIAGVVLFVLNNLLQPLLFNNNPQYFENYQRIIPTYLYPVIIFIIISTFLYHYTKFVIKIYKQYKDK